MNPRDETTPVVPTDSFQRNVLDIEVPLSVRLAVKRESIERILQLARGTIIEFPRSCEAQLELLAAGRTIAQGECVKVGERVGLRIVTFAAPAAAGPIQR